MTPSETDGGPGKQEGHDAKPEGASSEGPPLPPSPPVGGGDGGQEGQNGDNHNATGGAKSRWFPKDIKTAEWIMIAFTAFTAMAAWVGIWVSLGQLGAMKGQLNEMRAGANDTSTIANATSQFANAMDTQASETNSLVSDAGNSAKAAAEAAKAAEGQAAATRISADALKKQLAIQGATFEETYRPQLLIDPTAGGTLSIVDHFFTIGGIVHYRNIGNVNSKYISFEFDVAMFRDSATKQASTCERAEIHEKASIAGRADPGLYVKDHSSGPPMPAKQTYDDTAIAYIHVPIKQVGGEQDWPPDLPADKIPEQPTIAPFLVGCFSYVNNNTQAIHHSRVFYSLGEKGPHGNVIAIIDAPHYGSLVMTEYPVPGNLDD